MKTEFFFFTHLMIMRKKGGKKGERRGEKNKEKKTEKKAKKNLLFIVILST